MLRQTKKPGLKQHAQVVRQCLTDVAPCNRREQGDTLLTEVVLHNQATKKQFASCTEVAMHLSLCADASTHGTEDCREWPRDGASRWRVVG